MSEVDGVPRRVSDHVLHTLAKAIADAKAGSTTAVLIIAVNPDGIPRANFAGEMDCMPLVNFGFDLFKAQVIAQQLQAPGAAVMNSGIIKPN